MADDEQQSIERPPPSTPVGPQRACVARLRSDRQGTRAGDLEAALSEGEPITIDGVPTWFVQASFDQLAQADEDYCSVEVEVEAGDPIDASLVPELDRVHAHIQALEERRSVLSGRRELEEARAAEASLLQRIGVRSYDEVALRMATEQRATAARAKLPEAVRRRQEAEATWEAVAEATEEQSSQPR